MKETLSPNTFRDEAGKKNFAPDRKRFQERLNPLLPLIALDARSTIRHLTPTALNLLEYRTETPLGTSFFSHIHPGNLYPVMRDVADMVCYGKEKAAWMLRLRTGRQTWNWYRVHALNLLDTPEEIILLNLRELT
ncbi:hypothetical protein GQ464_017140 [Rhodocaloribacter litoris]|uniref:PAS domain-containing protein n=1 Tax=Rhodocaloribacter litoris TaxID=2558931 RepID=UPI001421B49F|nr:PAS domain-containing protein [Rhodocaloribacter litoris]QXD15107.1 hypothetical protein GQ464_017140 [Rhodocaloribacter litoris]GIV61057.1 MAG: hypothetical protein KatS3mg043_2146 [Rhodothermaceae bacterium]